MKAFVRKYWVTLSFIIAGVIGAVLIGGAFSHDDPIWQEWLIVIGGGVIGYIFKKFYNP